MLYVCIYIYTYISIHTYKYVCISLILITSRVLPRPWERGQRQRDPRFQKWNFQAQTWCVLWFRNFGGSWSGQFKNLFGSFGGLQQTSWGPWRPFLFQKYREPKAPRGRLWPNKFKNVYEEWTQKDAEARSFSAWKSQHVSHADKDTPLDFSKTLPTRSGRERRIGKVYREGFWGRFWKYVKHL